MRGIELWDTFSDCLLAELRDKDADQIAAGWSSSAARTKFYLGPDGVLDRVAHQMGMTFCREYMKLDGHLKRDDGFPQIFVEVENAPQSTQNEVEKLCYVRAPLKVLVTVSTWPNPPLRDMWLQGIADCAHWLPECPDVVYGLIIGQVKATQPTGRILVYHLLTASSTGVIITENREELIAQLR